MLGIQIAFEKVQERIKVMPIYEFDCRDPQVECSVDYCNNQPLYIFPLNQGGIDIFNINPLGDHSIWRHFHNLMSDNTQSMSVTYDVPPPSLETI